MTTVERDRIREIARRDRAAAAAITCPLCHAVVGTNGHRMNGKDCALVVVVVALPVATSRCIDCGARFPDDGGGDAVCPKCAQNYGD